MVDVTQHPSPSPMVTLNMQHPWALNVIQPPSLVNSTSVLVLEPLLNSIWLGPSFTSIVVTLFLCLGWRIAFEVNFITLVVCRGVFL